ncbi:conserved hypothetical protein [Burkholderia vietnamiensis]|nr:conserved hypothetical protein [Burkholderia vietnamiensis]SOT46146.1 hypothetical protein F01_570132 [Burkholderia cenocepacia]
MRTLARRARPRRRALGRGACCFCLSLVFLVFKIRERNRCSRQAVGGVTYESQFAAGRTSAGTQHVSQDTAQGLGFFSNPCALTRIGDHNDPQLRTSAK